MVAATAPVFLLLVLLPACTALAVPAFAQLSDMTGLNSRLYVEAAGREFEVLTTANFEVADASFDPETRTLRMDIVSELEGNIGEITIPRTLLDGDITMTLNDAGFFPDVRSNDRIWFVTAEFNGTGMHTLRITGTGALGIGGGDSIPGQAKGPQQQAGGGGNGCLVATAAYGTEMAPQVQMLRELRDGTVLATQSGSAFMAAFNPVYYSFSPTVADWERENPAFRAAVRAALAPMLGSLAVLGHAGIDTEHEMIAYGTAVIALNAAMYTGPVAAAVWAARAYRSRIKDCTS